MNIRQIIRPDLAVSVFAHLTFLTGVFLVSEVHPFAPVKTDTVAVDIVSPKEIAEKTADPTPEKEPKPPDPLDFSKADISTSPPSSSAAQQPASAEPPPLPSQATSPQPLSAKGSPQAAAKSQKSSAKPAPPDRQQIAALPAASAPSEPQSPPPPAPPSPTYTAPQPDISVKYHVLLGLPQDRPGDNFDAPATTAADVGNNIVADFRRYLKTCSKMPASVTPSDKVSIKLRVAMTPEGRLATAPQLIEASASAKGPLLFQSAIAALEACQPYAMLPRERYGEWKVLDLSFTPQDFSG